VEVYLEEDRHLVRLKALDLGELTLVVQVARRAHSEHLEEVPNHNKVEDCLEVILRFIFLCFTYFSSFFVMLFSLSYAKYWRTRTINWWPFWYSCCIYRRRAIWRITATDTTTIIWWWWSFWDAFLD